MIDKENITDNITDNTADNTADNAIAETNNTVTEKEVTKKKAIGRKIMQSIRRKAVLARKATLAAKAAAKAEEAARIAEMLGITETLEPAVPKKKRRRRRRRRGRMIIKEFKPDLTIPKDFTLIVDTREQIPLFKMAQWAIYKALKQGDYSVLGFEDKIAIERKTIPDLLSVIGRERERFEEEIYRLKDYWWKGLLIEGTESDVYAINQYSKVHPNAVYQSLASFEIRGFHIYYAPDKKRARWWVLTRLIKLYKHLREGQDVEKVGLEVAAETEVEREVGVEAEIEDEG